LWVMRLTGPRAKRLRINGRNPIPVSTRAKDPGSGTVVIDEVKVPAHDDVVGLVVVHVLVIVDSPLSPANIPVPPVTRLSVVTVPFTVPLPVKVPNRVPPAKTFMNVPLDVNVVKLVKSAKSIAA